MSSNPFVDKLQNIKTVTSSYTFRRIFIAGVIVISLYCTLIGLRSHSFSVSIHTNTSKLPTTTAAAQLTPRNKYNESKIALLIENRASPILAPLLLHFISVVPPDWKFRFMGSQDSVAYLNTSRAIQSHVGDGKLDLAYIPSNMTTGSQEEISVFLTTLWLYEEVLQPAEWLLVFQTDSILCSNSRQDLNSWLEYDWVGAPWVLNSGGGGNGGLSMRRVSRIVDILRTHKRQPNGPPEDVFLSGLLESRTGSKMANGTISLKFSGEQYPGAGEKSTAEIIDGKVVGETEDAVGNGELIKGIDDWRDGHYEPMGYHIGNSGAALHAGIWGKLDARKHIWSYCPEIKMILQMDARRYVPGDCGTNWKRDTYGGDNQQGLDDAGQPNVEMIDGEMYDRLPPNLMAW
ncbi:hypothetical protein BJ878DRAFT_73733 [Calycina marina]|uniref:DUF5672 domain-containing protein n=1 Tax=Calycina marina TaxID=1763456 RepID=A0A9P8CGE2_9HELO|nr:hypothetical protein BJ878DRAFT_73733 [Calycina marina]